MQWSLREPKMGDIIRKEIGHNIHHYGIFISDNEIIEFGKASEAFGPKENVRVRTTTIKEFLSKGFIEVREYTIFEKLKKKSVNDIVENARKRIGEAGYDIIENNCEHFVNECVFGKHISLEVSSYQK